MIKLRRLESDVTRAWSVLEHGAVQAAQSRFDSGLAFIGLTNARHRSCASTEVEWFRIKTRTSLRGKWNDCNERYEKAWNLESMRTA